MSGRDVQGESLPEEAVTRVVAALSGAMRRKPSHEPQLGGALRALVPASPRLLREAGEAVETLVRRGSFDRPLYAALIRTVAELDPARAARELERVLATDEAGGLPALSAASLVGDARLAAPLARAAASRHSHVAFAAEIARAARGEAAGDHLAAIAPKIKEAHRIALCVEVLVPLLRRPSLPLSVAPALAVLRDTERHLGRWLVFAEIAARAGDPAPLAEARARATDGPASARAAWGLVAWALAPGEPPGPPRPTVELVARLSDRPSADRDPTFLYRLADARAPQARPMLEGLARSPLRSDAAVRSALYLARDHGRAELRAALGALARNPRQEAIRGLAAAALHDLGETEGLAELTAELLRSRRLETSTWAALVIAAADRPAGRRVVEDPIFRRVQLGWIE